MEDMDFMGMMRSFLQNGGSAGGAVAKVNPWVGGATAALGTVQAITGFNQLKKLDARGLPEYKLNDKMQNSIAEADSMRGMGYTPQEMASIQDRLERSQATGFQKASDASPNLVSVIQAGINYADQDQQLAIGRQDASLRRDNIKYSDSLRKESQQIDNMNVQEKINNYYKKQSSFGRAAETGLNNIIEGGGMLTDGLGSKKDSTNNTGSKFFGKGKSKLPKASGGFMDIFKPSEDYSGYGMGDLNFA